MALGRQDISVARTDGSADVFCLTGFLGDDNLIGHVGLNWEDGFGDRHANISGTMCTGKLTDVSDQEVFRDLFPI